MHDSRILACALILGLVACGQSDEPGPAPLARTPQSQQLIEDAEFELGKGDLAAARRLYDQALAANPDDAAVWVEVARLRFRNGDHAGALDAVDHALTLDPQSSAALLMRGQMVRDAHGPGAAIPWFERGLAVHPRDADLLAEYAATLGDYGRNRDMLAAVRTLAEVNPRDPRVHFLQAVLAARAGQYVMAASLLERSGMRAKGVPSAVLLGAVVDMQQGTYDNAVTELDVLYRDQPSNRRVAEMLAQALWLGGRDREIIERFGWVRSRPDASPYLTMLVGRSLERSGERAEASKVMALARTRPSGKLSALPAGVEGLPAPTGTMREYLDAGNFSAADEHASRVARQFPGSADILTLAGDAALAGRDGVRAEQYYGKAAAIRRPWPLTRKLVYLLREEGDGEAADTLLARHLRNEPRNAEALFMLARRSAEREDWLRAAILLDNAIALGAGNDPELLGLRIEVARKSGDDNKAEELRTVLAGLRPPAFVKR